jgi:hypothetical protein
VPCGVVCGIVDDDVAERLPTRSLVADHGEQLALGEPLMCIEKSASALISELIG